MRWGNDYRVLLEKHRELGRENLHFRTLQKYFLMYKERITLQIPQLTMVHDKAFRFMTWDCMK